MMPPFGVWLLTRVHPPPTFRERNPFKQVAEFYRGRQQQLGRGCGLHPASTTVWVGFGAKECR
jgi:hypothetical protein